MLTGSAFKLNRESRNGGVLSFWRGRAQSSFHGREGAPALNGEVRTAMFSADYTKDRLLAGLSLVRSMSLSGYQAETAGEVQSAVTGLYPWLGYRVSKRVSVWGVTGYGSGSLLLTPGGGAPLESALSMAMAASGTRGDLVAGAAGGFALAFKANALWVGTSIDSTDGPEGQLAAQEPDTGRHGPRGPRPEHTRGGGGREDRGAKPAADADRSARARGPESDGSGLGAGTCHFHPGRKGACRSAHRTDGAPLASRSA